MLWILNQLEGEGGELADMTPAVSAKAELAEQADSHARELAAQRERLHREHTRELEAARERLRAAHETEVAGLRADLSNAAIARCALMSPRPGGRARARRSGARSVAAPARQPGTARS